MLSCERSPPGQVVGQDESCARLVVFALIFYAADVAYVVKRASCPPLPCTPCCWAFNVKLPDRSQNGSVFILRHGTTWWRNIFALITSHLKTHRFIDLCSDRCRLICSLVPHAHLLQILLLSTSRFKSLQLTLLINYMFASATDRPWLPTCVFNMEKNAQPVVIHTGCSMLSWSRQECWLCIWLFPWWSKWQKAPLGSPAEPTCLSALFPARPPKRTEWCTTASHSERNAT